MPAFTGGPRMPAHIHETVRSVPPGWRAMTGGLATRRPPCHFSLLEPHRPFSPPGPTAAGFSSRCAISWMRDFALVALKSKPTTKRLPKPHEET
jgi:hypothetical protein